MDSSKLNPGYRIGKYELAAHIASGGMGSVYRATDLELRRTVALKVLPFHQAQNSACMERFRREARSAARLNHPNIVTLYECGYDSDEDIHYLAMELIEGTDLGEYIARKGKLTPEEARRILYQAAKALEHAFAQGIVHRDIKPSNFLMSKLGDKIIVKMTDFGLARLQDDDDFRVTREGSTVGTIDYISPEQARDSQSADIRSDLYSLGCTAYHMLAGHPPFPEGGLAERLHKHMEVAPPDLRQFNPKVSDRFWALLSKLLSKSPENRYANPTELVNALKNTPAEEVEKKAPRPRAHHDGLGRRKVGQRITPEKQRPATTVSDSNQQTPAPSTASMAAPIDDVAALIKPEQLRAAAALHDRARQVLIEGGGLAYARDLLNKCIKMDPFTLAHHMTMRELNKKAPQGGLGRWFGSPKLKSQLRAAKANREWRKVLEIGDEILQQQPGDVEALLEMATAAQTFELPNLAMWLLHQAREKAPDNIDVIRSMARVLEKFREWKQAYVLWELVKKAKPDDQEARHRIKDLAEHYQIDSSGK